MATTTCTSYHLVYSIIKPFEMTSLLLNRQFLYRLINVNVVLMQEIQLGTAHFWLSDHCFEPRSYSSLLYIISYSVRT